MICTHTMRCTNFQVSYALLIGSIGTFVVIALVMFLTRKLDWFGED